MTTITTTQETGLATLNKDGSVPETRMKDAQAVQDFAKQLRDCESEKRRAFKRSRAEGLVGGNPPFKASKMRDAGMAGNHNVNFGTARGYMEAAHGAFYDLSSEAPGVVSITTEHGTPEEQLDYSRVMSEEADRVFYEDEAWDFDIQQSQWQMVLHGRGPFVFEDEMAVLPRSIHDGDLKVPEMTRADTHYWEAAAIDVDYYPTQLQKFINNEAAANQTGWNVEYTKQVIANAVKLGDGDKTTNYEFAQQQIKNSCLTYMDDTKVIKASHVFWTEFDGRITHAIVEQTTSGKTTDEKTSQTEFLYRKIGRYASWKEAIHPMYMDRGHGGYHHSVTGLGVKMYGPMEAENRLMNNLMDKASAPRVLFKPTAEARQKMELAHFGEWGVLPAGYDAVQVPIQGFLTDGLAMFQTTSRLMQSNLSGYRQQVPMKETGNPATAKEVSIRAADSSTLSRPIYNRYYRQLDLLYTEIVRRLCKATSMDPRAIAFQDRCRKLGVPDEAFAKVKQVLAVRVIGQGNPFMRQQAVGSLMPIVQRLPEDGQQRWMNDYIACFVGQSGVERYNPQRTASKLPSDQELEALQCVAMMKVGVPPIVTSTQNPVIYARTYLKAGAAALLSLQQGADEMEVYRFMSMVGPATLAQLQRIKGDPMRDQAFEPLFKMWQQMAKLTDLLRDRIEKGWRERQAQQQLAQKTMTEEELKAMRAANTMNIQQRRQAMAEAKHEQQMRHTEAKTRQQLALDDATSASEIMRKNREAEAKAEQMAMQAEAAPAE